MPGVAEVLPPLHFVSFNPTSGVGKDELVLRAEQIQFFMEEEIRPFYEGPESEGGLGLKYIDDEPYTLAQRVNLLLQSGPLQDAGREYILGYVPDEAEKFPEDEAALMALAILRKPYGLCTDDEHKPTEIAEFDLARKYRGSRAAPSLLHKVVECIGEHDEPVELDVALPNVHAQRFYQANTFSVDKSVGLLSHNVYNVRHQRMVSTTTRIALGLPLTNVWKTK